MNLIDKLEGNILSDLGNMLLEHSYKEGVFTLTSGKESDFYINGKKTFLDGKGLWLVSKCFSKMIFDSGLDVQAVAGVTLGADPLIAGISMLNFTESGINLPQIIIRKEPKGHGACTQLEVAGTVPDGATVALVDDVLTTGGTLVRKGVKVLTEAGYRVVFVGVIVDREEGGREHLEQNGIENMQSIFTRTELLALKS